MYKIYQVEYGDTLDIIANKAGTTVDNIKTLNGFTTDEDLTVGSLVIIPKPDNRYFQKYMVKNGDNVYSIARMFDLDPNTIFMLNGLNKNDYIYPNQELTLPSNDVVLYVTKEGDTIDFITNSLGVDANMLNNENNKIYVIEDQLIVHKKEINS